MVLCSSLPYECRQAGRQNIFVETREKYGFRTKRIVTKNISIYLKFHFRKSGRFSFVDDDAVSGLVHVVIQPEIGRHSARSNKQNIK